MIHENKDPRRRLLLSQAAEPGISWEWDAQSYIRAKNIRTVALSGMQNLKMHGLEISKPVGIVEMLGSRIATVSTVMLAIFSLEDSEKKSSFQLKKDLALGVLYFPPAMFSGIAQLVSAPAVYFRMGKDGSSNAISNDVNFKPLEYQIFSQNEEKTRR